MFSEHAGHPQPVRCKQRLEPATAIEDRKLVLRQNRAAHKIALQIESVTRTTNENAAASSKPAKDARNLDTLAPGLLAAPPQLRG